MQNSCVLIILLYICYKKQQLKQNIMNLKEYVNFVNEFYNNNLELAELKIIDVNYNTISNPVIESGLLKKHLTRVSSFTEKDRFEDYDITEPVNCLCIS